MNPMVTAGLLSLLPRLEGRIPYMYLDRKEKVTVGIGCLLANAGIAAGLPFRRRDGSVAPREEIKAAFECVAARRDIAGLYAQFNTVTSLRLPEGAMDTLCLDRIAATETELRRWFGDVDVWPLDAQMGAMIMVFALGSNISGFPRFQRACGQKDWVAAAGQTHWRYQRPERAQALRTCFLNAAATVSSSSYLPTILYYPMAIVDPRFTA